MSNTESETIRIESTRDSDGPAQCLLRWGALEWYAPVDDVRTTASDLQECAIYAELMMLMVSKLKLPKHSVSMLTRDLIKLGHPDGRPPVGCATTLKLTPAGSSRTGEPAVIVERGSQAETISTAIAREMAAIWRYAAEAAESDQLVADALTATLKVDEGWIDGFFDLLKQMRGAQGDADRLLASLVADVRQGAPRCAAPDTCEHVFHCPTCGAGSGNPKDAENRYCGACGYQ